MKGKYLADRKDTFFSFQSIKSANGDDEQCFAFCGVDRHGKFRVKIFETKFLVDGAVYVLKQMVDYQGKKKIEKFLVNVTPGFKLDVDPDLYKMTCSETGESMLITGNFTIFLEKIKL